MAQGGNILTCSGCRHWDGDKHNRVSLEGFCLRENMDALGNYAGPVKITYALDECSDFVPKFTWIESARPATGDSADRAHAPAGACR
jgi:hypothetical protein